MAKKNSPESGSFFSASFPPAMLEEILQRIDENLYSRPVLSNQTERGTESIHGFDHLPLPPLPPDFLEKIAVMRNAQAPYYVVSGNPITRLIKRMHNLVLKVFGRKQAYFNNLAVHVLEATVAYLSASQEHNKSQTVLTNSLARQMTLQMEQFTAMQTDYEQLVAQVEQLAAGQGEYQGLSERVEKLITKQNDIQQQVESIQTEIRVLSDKL